METRPLLYQLLIGIAVLYLACTVLRLARFNVSNSPDPAAHKRFRGLPSPGAAGCVASLAIIQGELPAKLHHLWQGSDLESLRSSVHRFVELFAPLGTLIVALLMVSVISFPHLTKNLLAKKRHGGHLIQIFLAALILILLRELALALVFWTYAFFFPIRSAVLRYLRRQDLESSARLDDAIPRG